MKGWTRRFVHLILTLLLGVPTAFANVSSQGGNLGGGEHFTALVVSSDTNSVGTIIQGNQLLGFKLVATGSNATCGLYDSATTPASGTTSLVDELYEATSGMTDLHIWPMPYVVQTDLSVVVKNGVCIIYLR